MTRATLTLTALALTFVTGAAGRAAAATVTLSPVSQNSAFTTTSGDPYLLFPALFGYLPVGTGNVFDRSSAAQFDLSGLQGLTITSATLTLDAPAFTYNVAGGDGTSTFDVAVNGYTGSGTVDLSDFSATPEFTAGAFSQSLTVSGGVDTDETLTPITLDVTSFVTSQVAGGSPFGGFRFDPTNPAGNQALDFTVDFYNAVLTVEVAAVPEPSTLALTLLAAPAAALFARRKAGAGR